MKKFALLAMLLGSSFLYGCGETAKTPAAKTNEPAATGTEKKEGTTTPTTEEKKDGAATEEKK